MCLINLKNINDYFKTEIIAYVCANTNEANSIIIIINA